MKKKLCLAICSVLIFIAIGATGCEGFTPPISQVPSTGGSITSQQNTGISVTGEGKVTVVPDVTVLSLGVVAQTVTIAQAQSEASTAIDAVVRELSAGGVASNDIKTRYFNIQRVTRWDNDRQQEIVIGYRVSNTVTAKIRKVADTGAIIDAVVRAGGDYTRINNISFTVDDPAPYQKEARIKAVADAEAKAKQLADAAGVKLGAPIYINESGGYVPIVMREVTFAQAAPAAAPTTPISPGETEIILNVQVVYRIR